MQVDTTMKADDISEQWLDQQQVITLKRDVIDANGDQGTMYLATGYAL